MPLSLRLLLEIKKKTYFDQIAVELIRAGGTKYAGKNAEIISLDFKVTNQQLIMC